MPTDIMTITALRAFLDKEKRLAEQQEEIARRLAEPNLSASEREVLKAEQQFGPGVTTESGNLAFTDPTGMTRTFAPRGQQVSMQLPTHYTNDYSPEDQKRIENLYRQRSEIALDPDLNNNEDARQQALDQVDTELSSIPHLSPEMREPSAQQQFDAALVQGPDGQMGTWNGEKFSPIESSKAESQAKADRQKQYSSFFNRELDLLNKEEKGEDPKARPMSERIRLAHERAQIGVDVIDPAMAGGVDMAQAMFGETLPRGGGKVTAIGPPGLESIWQKLETREDREEALALLHPAKGRRAWTPEEIIAAYKKKISEK
jgi:hypothetical protein